MNFLSHLKKLVPNFKALFGITGLLFFYLLPSVKAGSNLDSLFNVWRNKQLPDTVRLKAMDSFISKGYLYTKPDSAFYFGELMYNFAKEKKNKKFQAQAYQIQGSASLNKGDYDKALFCDFLSLKIYQLIDDKNGQARIYGNIGNAYLYKSNYPEALNNNLKALKISEQLGDKNRIATQLLNIGGIYREQENYVKALPYFLKSLKIFTAIDGKKGIASNLLSIGLVYQKRNEYSIAYDYFIKALVINKELGNDYNISINYLVLGEIYQEFAIKSDLAKNYEKKDSMVNKSFEFYNNALKIAQKSDDKYTMSSVLGDMGTLALLKKDYYLSEMYLQKAILISQDISALDLISDQHKNLSELYLAKKKFKEALENYKKHIVIKDSLLNENNSRKILQREADYNYEQKVEKMNIIRNEELKVTNAQLQKDKILKIALYGGLGLTFIFLLFIRNRLNVSRKQNKIIEIQKQETEQQNKEITASIRYAKRIQAAILPSDATINSLLKNSFVVYKPKDIVAGDFYWLEELNENVIFAAADCTGHGVPGAMVSVVCNNALNRCVREFGISDPGKILDKTREIIISEFQKSDEELQDGMDISLCALNRMKNELLWAGANNLLWIIRNNELIEIKPDKQPIGKYSHQKTFTTHSVELQKNDTLYIFTDGYQDQFGGEDGKKFKVANLKNLLLRIHDESLEKQKETISSTFEKWRGRNEQVDDVCIIGVKI